MQEFVATTFQGLEEVLANEIRELGGEEVEVLHRAVGFKGDQALLYRANYCLRTAVRILQPIWKGRVRDQRELYNAARSIDWKRYFSPEKSFSIQPVVSQAPNFNNSQFVAFKTKDGIVDEFKRTTGLRPNVELRNPDVAIHVRLFQEECTISLDSSGSSLHQRGYRIRTHQAPLNEVLAAGILALSDWSPEQPFLDPMCGSGTLLIEAALMATKRPPQFLRLGFAFEHWLDFEPALWKLVKETVQAQVLAEPPAPIFGADVSRKTMRLARKNIAHAELSDAIQLSTKSFEELTPPVEQGVLVFNPPYDERMPKRDIFAFYGMIGDRLKQQFAGWTAHVFSGNLDALKKVGLKADQRIPLYNGPIEARLYRFKLFEGHADERTANYES